MSDPVARLNEALEGRYAIERELGEGGMATVYLADDLKHERKVALKVLKPELAAVVGAERFLAEIKTTAKLQHPNILPLFDSGEADSFLFYVMPYVEGESLREKLDREHQLPIGEATRISVAVAQALDHAHRKGVIHRDVKPANILLQDGGPLLADFGIALAMQSTSASRLTETGTFVGTLEYMSPEQAMGEVQLGPASDIYALGCVLYEMLTGEPPHTGATIQSAIVKLLTEQPTRPRALRNTVPQALDAAVMKSLAKLPPDRFATAERFAQVLSDSREATASAPPAPAPIRVDPVECTYQLRAEVCGELDRAELDPRMIGDDLHYLDNQVESDVFVCYVHGFGGDHRIFQEILKTCPYRGLALSLYGFEPTAERRASLSMKSHQVLVRHFLADTVEALRPGITILVGFSSGADFLFDLLECSPREWSVEVDGLLALGCNLSLDTCFVSGVFARLTSESGVDILPDLQAAGATAASLGEWLDIHEYLVTMLRKFQLDLGPLRRHGQEIVRPFEAGEDPFPRWFQVANARVSVVRCVFADNEMEAGAVQRLLFDHLDSGVLGEHYSEASIQIETGAGHFDLLAPQRANRHVEEIVTRVHEL